MNATRSIVLISRFCVDRVVNGHFADKQTGMVKCGSYLVLSKDTRSVLDSLGPRLNDVLKAAEA